MFYLSLIINETLSIGTIFINLPQTNKQTNMKKLIIITLSIVTILVACSKDQKVVRNLEGTWKVTAQTYDGQAVPAEEYANTSYEFEKCRVKKEDCPGMLTASDSTKGSYSFPFTYKIHDDGEKITINMNFLGMISSMVGDIKENSKSTFIFSTVEDGKTSVTTLTKQ